MPTYFRIDFLKLIICLNTINETDCTMFADFNLKPIGPDFLFKEKHIEQLNAWGWLNGNLENKFMIMVNKPGIIDALRHMVNWCLFQAQFAVNDSDSKKLCSAAANPLAARYLYLAPCSIVAGGTANGSNLQRYYALKEFGSIRIKKDPATNQEMDQEYDPDIHGYLPLGNFGFNRRSRESASVLTEHGCGLSTDYLEFLDSQGRDSYDYFRKLVGHASSISYTSTGTDHIDDITDFLKFTKEHKNVATNFWKRENTSKPRFLFSYGQTPFLRGLNLYETSSKTLWESRKILMKRAESLMKDLVYVCAKA